MESKATVFLVDDDPAVRDAVGMFLTFKGHVVKTFDSARAFLEAGVMDRPGCLVVDIRMPGMSGMALHDELIARNIDIPVIFISGHGDISKAVIALKRGALDFLEKPFDNHKLLSSVEEAIQYDFERRKKLYERTEIIDRYHQLTPRERQVMVLVADGKSNKDIGRRLDISHRTVEIHRRRLMEKLGAASVSQLVSASVLCGVYELRMPNRQVALD